MSFYTIDLNWNRDTKESNPENFNRNHTISFPGGSSLEVSSAPEFFGEKQKSNPEELFIATISSCFMLTFLSITMNKGIMVESYVDHATGTRGKNANGKTAITEVTLRPQITFQKGMQPDIAIVRRLLEKTQANCFITNSINTIVSVQPEVEFA